MQLPCTGCSSAVSLTCPTGTKVISGGYNVVQNQVVSGSGPISVSAWGVFYTSTPGGSQFITIFVVCAVVQ